MTLQTKSPGDAPGIYQIATRGRELKHLSFRIAELGGALNEYSFETGVEEVSLNSYTGAVRVAVDGTAGAWRADIPVRESIAQPGTMVFAPPDSTVTLTALDASARLTIAGALGAGGTSGPALLSAEKKSVGKDNWTRTVYTYIADNVAAARLICGETVNQPGGWSSCPPHKHDQNRPPQEVPMEEVYYFQFEPKQGFGFMRVYSDAADAEPFDYAYAVEHGDTVLIPRGYHPVVACPGYTLHYTWVLAGVGRTYGAWTDDPQHAWIKR